MAANYKSDTLLSEYIFIVLSRISLQVGKSAIIILQKYFKNHQDGLK
jgi:hypothetical protein